MIDYLGKKQIRVMIMTDIMKQFDTSKNQQITYKKQSKGNTQELHQKRMNMKMEGRVCL